MQAWQRVQVSRKAASSSKAPGGRTLGTIFARFWEDSREAWPQAVARSRMPSRNRFRLENESLMSFGVEMPSRGADSRKRSYPRRGTNGWKGWNLGFPLGVSCLKCAFPTGDSNPVFYIELNTTDTNLLPLVIQTKIPIIKNKNDNKYLYLDSLYKKAINESNNGCIKILP